MATYEYENALGERREIVASMREPPPETIWLKSDGSWEEFGTGAWAAHEFRDVTTNPLTRGRVFQRVYSNQQKPVVVNHAIRNTHGGLPVSRTLPLRAGGTVTTDGGRKIKVHADGMRTDLSGRPIVATKEDQKRVEAHYGVSRE